MTMKDQLSKVREILELDVVVDNVLSADLEAAHKALDTIAQAGDGVVDIQPTSDEIRHYFEKLGAKKKRTKQKGRG